MNKKIIVIVGPTGSGKTDLSIDLALKFNGECINADSTQIFQGTDIATNKISFTEMRNIPHHLFSIRKADQPYSVAEFQRDARASIAEILTKNKTPIIVGGTGLYINALIKNFDFPIKDKIENWEELNKNVSNEDLWKELSVVDPFEAKIIPANNRKRVLRALELFRLTNKIKQDRIKNNANFYYNNLIIIGLDLNKNDLNLSLNNRVDHLVKRGLFNEITNLYYQNNQNPHLQSLKIIGGKEIIAYLNKQITFDQAIMQMQTANRRYARKQRTWFKYQLTNVKWFSYKISEFSKIKEKIIDYLNQNL